MSGHGDRDPESLPAFLQLNVLPAGSGARERRAPEAAPALPHHWGGQGSMGPSSGTGRGAASCPASVGWGYLSDIFLLLLLQGQQDEDLLQLLIAVVDDELLKAVVL